MIINISLGIRTLITTVYDITKNRGIMIIITEMLKYQSLIYSELTD